MELKIDRIKALMQERGWNASELARQMGISKSEVSRMLQGKHNGGNKTIEGLYRAFPGETKESLFILPVASPFVNTVNNDIDTREHVLIEEIPIKHPQAHHLACMLKKETDRNCIEIKDGNKLVTLYVPPGNIEASYSTE